jgi:oligogalacturonide lyase
MLTSGPQRDWVIYQTHPMWTPGMRRLVFNSDRSGTSSLCALDLHSGEVRPLVDGPAGICVLSRKDDRLYFLHGRDVMMTRVDEAFNGAPKAERVSTLPTFAVSSEGGFTLDVKEDVLYTGAVLAKDKSWGVLALDLPSGAWRKVVETDFRVGHFQANPVRSGVVMFCWETGGDAPQRTWTVNADGSGLRPVYKETYDEWVTHEAWWGADRIIFTVWPYDDEHMRKPHGILSADFATGTPTVRAQYKAWHTQGSPDGKWILGDDFDRNLWLVKADTNERRLLTQGHLGKGCDTHPHASFTPDSKSIVFSSSKNGTDDIFLVEIPKWDSLPPAS